MQAAWSGGSAASNSRACDAGLKEAAGNLFEKLADPAFAIALSDLKDAMSALKSATCFGYLGKIADRALVRFPDAIEIWTLYAEALINSGEIQAGIEMLEAARRKPNVSPACRMEILGLLGRANKQLYVENAWRQKNGPGGQAPLHTVFAASHRLLCKLRRSGPAEFCDWHGINLVSLLRLAQMDGLAVRNPTNRTVEQLAGAIGGVLEPKAAAAGDPYLLASLGVAGLAAGDYDKARRYLSRFLASPKRDAFALGGLIRQLEEVFRIQPDQTEPGKILAVLKAAEMGQAEGKFRLDGNSLAGFAKLAASQEHRDVRESMVPDGGFVKLAELQSVVSRAQAIAAVCDQDGRTFGTGFLVRGDDLNPRWGEDIYLVTNAHVMYEGTSGDAPLTPATARFVLEGAGGKTLLAESKAAWQSPFGEYDACIVRIIGRVDVEPLRIADEGLPMLAEDTQKGQEGLTVSVIGYPRGGPLQLSVVGTINGANGRLVDIGPRRPGDRDPVYLHYRAPTEPGNSGSPVFETKTWTIVGLHHAGFDSHMGLPRLGGRPGSNMANEGISIWSIKRALAGC